MAWWLRSTVAWPVCANPFLDAEIDGKHVESLTMFMQHFIYIFVVAPGPKPLILTSTFEGHGHHKSVPTWNGFMMVVAPTYSTLESLTMAVPLPTHHPPSPSSQTLDHDLESWLGTVYDGRALATPPKCSRPNVFHFRIVNDGGALAYSPSFHYKKC